LLKLLRYSCKNWFEVLPYILTNNDKIKAEFRNGKIIQCNRYRLIIAFVPYYYFSHKLGVFSDSDFTIFYEVYLDISKKLKKAIDDGILVQSGVGGSFGYEEALLFALIRYLKPSTVVETGVAQGISSYVILKALELNRRGRLMSVDLPNPNPNGYRYANGTVDPVYTPTTLGSGWIVPDELRDRWTLLIGRSKEILPTLSIEVDFFFHDSEHSYENMLFEYEWAYSRISQNGVIASDDIGWNQAFRDFAKTHPDLRPIIHGLGYEYQFGLWRHDQIEV